VAAAFSRVLLFNSNNNSFSLISSFTLRLRPRFDFLSFVSSFLQTVSSFCLSFSITSNNTLQIPVVERLLEFDEDDGELICVILNGDELRLEDSTIVTSFPVIISSFSILSIELVCSTSFDVSIGFFG
jgi:hypothetical protein